LTSSVYAESIAARASANGRNNVKFDTYRVLPGREATVCLN
jgi:hypothetical protein